MTETQKRIKAYKKALPHMKDRVIAAVTMLAMAVSMMTAATFAWMTLSRNPEVSSIATTVTTNGNLEIALSGEEGLQPADSTTSDGGRDVKLTNLTWGNLINLSSEQYGLSSIQLRPASLDPNTLASSPIYATQYASDGRVNGYITDFAYTSYDPVNKKYQWYQDMRYGVRAVSSVTYEAPEEAGQQYKLEQMDRIDKLYKKACEDFKTLYENEGYMKVVYRVVQEYANIQLKNEPQDISDEMDNLMLMVEGLSAVIDTLGEFYAETANLAYCNAQDSVAEYSRPYKLEHVVGNTIPKEYVKHLTYYTAYRTMHNEMGLISKGIKVAQTKAQQNQEVYWADIAEAANKLCYMPAATINGATLAEIKADITGYAGKIIFWDVVPAVIEKGLMKDLDQFLAGNFYVKSRDSLSITVTLGISKTLHPNVYTAAYKTTKLYAAADYNATYEIAQKEGNLKGIPAAAQTYALALDMWVRTNQDDALLILEGDIITETRTILGEDSEGNPVDTYVYTYTDSDKQEQKLVVYKVTESGTTTWYVADSHTPLADVVGTVNVTNENPALNTEEVPVGYGGVNRVWDEMDGPDGAAAMLPPGTTSTTQGSGSCYIFYPEAVEDQGQAKKLLSAMRIAFIEGDKLLATAYLDTESAIETAGRVIVPMKLQSNIKVDVGDGKEEEYYVTQLKKNEARRITTMIYLEGNGLSNSDVLAAGTIAGQLNIQFGTNKMELDPMDNDELMQDYYSITKIGPAGDAQNPFTFAKNQEWALDVKMLIEGIQPSKVKANFLSVVSATQGARQPEFELKLNPETGNYEARVKFDMPGSYQLRSLQIDGVDYALDAEDVVYVKVPGIGIGALSWNGDENRVGNTVTKLSAEMQYQRSLSLALGSDDGRVHDVQGVFLGDNGQNVTVNFKHASGANYQGTATFNSSGVYKMSYLYIDGALTQLDSDLHKTMKIQLGLTAEVRLSSPVIVGADGMTQAEKDRILSELSFEAGEGYSFVYNGEKDLLFGVECIIKDDAGKTIEGKENVMLYYGQGTTFNALYTALEWNGSEYVGELPMGKYGIFKFNSVRLGETDYITKASAAHNIVSIPADPMAYVGNNLKQQNDGPVFGIGAERNFEIRLANASAATMELTLEYTDSKGEKTTYVAGVYDAQKNIGYRTSADGDDTVFTFTVPKDGQWKIVGAKIGTVFYNDVFYEGKTDADGNKLEDTWLDLYALMTQINANMDIKFITEVTPELIVEGAENGVFDLGTKKIGESFNLSNAMKLKVIFKAYDGKNVAEYLPAGQQLTATVADSYKYGSKVNATVKTGSVTPVNITGNASIGGSTTQMELTVDAFTVDGIWNAPDPLVVTLNGNEYKISGLPKVKVAWDKPSVTIAAVNPDTTTQIPTKITWKVSTGWIKTPSFTYTGQTYNSISANGDEAYVYAKAQSQGTGDAGFALPTISFAATGVDSLSTVKFTIPAGAATAKNVTITGNGTSSAISLGKNTGTVKSWKPLLVTYTLYKFEGHGDVTISQITLERGGITYTMDIKTPVKIHNPSSVNQTS